jgi:predicted Zn-dependent protease
LLLLAPQHPRPHYFRALIAYGAGDYEAAIQHLGQILRAYPDYRPAEILLGATHYAKGNFEQADKYLSSALAADPSSEAARRLLAATRLRQQKTQDLPATLLASEPDTLPAISTLAALEMRQGNVKQALARARGLQQGTDKDKATGGYMLEGDLHMAQGQFENAARAYDAASRRVESAAVAIRLYEARRQAKAADAATPLEQWLSTHPDDSRVRLVLAQEYQNRGQLKKAAAEYELLLKSEPDNAVVLNNLAWVYHETMDPRALGLAERAHAAQPEVGAITDTLGWLLVQEGQVQRGLTLLREAEKQAPKIPDIRYHLAVALAKTGATEEARRILADLVDSGKSFNEMAEAKQLLQQL